MNYLPLVLVFLFPFVIAAADNKNEKPITVSDLEWLAGQWREVSGEIEEHWMAPRAETMLGMSRTVTKKGRVEFEFIRIAATTNGIAYIAQPFGRPPTIFLLKEHGHRRVVFENLEHDFPQVIRYWLDDTGTLHTQIQGIEGGTKRQMEWVWQKEK